MSDVLPPLEQALVALLKSLTGAQVGTKVPQSRPDRFIRLSRTGGASSNRAQSAPTVLVECWGADEGKAWALCASVLPVLRAHRDGADLDGVVVCDASVTEPVNYPDSATGTPRYQFIYSPTVITEGASL